MRYVLEITDQSVIDSGDKRQKALDELKAIQGVLVPVWNRNHIEFSFEGTEEEMLTALQAANLDVSKGKWKPNSKRR
ncbi:hypothetical protein [Achromobacter xylosoxidans]|uniref:hypothetical protein n=1 Tax=Alcaligenes xylosoxydans xylosoxydans TaxID=85698 RepID=UPI0022B926DF|nr:hypothetical protein [Achromobacter xylosoxidans]MCZ8393447.1 hypothetical protein [Achromobacter xylosoxidans]